jgi:hypothetical protein
MLVPHSDRRNDPSSEGGTDKHAKKEDGSADNNAGPPSVVGSLAPPNSKSQPATLSNAISLAASASRKGDGPREFWTTPVQNSMYSRRRCFDRLMRPRTLLVLVGHGRYSPNGTYGMRRGVRIGQIRQIRAHTGRIVRVSPKYYRLQLRSLVGDQKSGFVASGTGTSPWLKKSPLFSLHWTGWIGSSSTRRQRCTAV